MCRLFARFSLGVGLLSAACATAVDESGGLGGDLGDDGGTSFGGALSTSGTGNPGPGPGTAGSSVNNDNGGKAGMPSGAFGGTTTTGGDGGGAPNGGKAGSSTGGKAGAGSGGTTAGSSTGGSKATGGTSNGGSAGAGTAGSGSAGSPASTVCDDVPDWTSKAYAIGDTVASSCAAPFNDGCPIGQSHKFECNPVAGAVALNWCKERQPGAGNGWAEAWVDKGQCQ
jgi:hypothetical protein